MDKAINTKTIKITKEILNLISEIDEFKGAWQAIGRISPDRLQNLKRVATVESVGSSTRIEGAQLTDNEVEAILLNKGIQKFSSRDEQEVAGYGDVMNTVFANYGDISLTENHVKQFHRDLLRYSIKDERHRGEYKTMSNNVEAFDASGKSLGVIFKTATPFSTPKLMQELIDWINENFDLKINHPLITIAIFIVTFLEIHPFQDGNGRLSRILTTLLLLKKGYYYVPFSSLESIIEQQKEFYYLALRKTQSTIRLDKPNWQPWLVFFLKILKQQKDRLQNKILREKQLFQSLPELSIQILDLAKEHGRITVRDIVKFTKASRNTIKDHLSKLTTNGNLKKHGQGRGVWYSL